MRNPDTTEWLNLNPNEEPIYWEHPAIISVLPIMVMGVAVSLVGIAMTIMYPIFSPWPLALVPFGVATVLFEYLRWSRTHYVITNVRVVTKEGIWSRDYDEVPHQSITNTDSSQTVLERILRIGDIEIYTAGTGGLEMKLVDLPRFNEASDIISKQKTSHGSDG